MPTVGPEDLLQDHWAATAYLDDAEPEMWQVAYKSVFVLPTEYGVAP
jgi:hypothetical protein